MSDRESRSLQGRQADSLEQLVQISTEMRNLLALIAASSDQSALTNPGVGEAGLLDILKDVQLNGIGGAI